MNSSIMDIEVSCFADYTSVVSEPINLLVWLRSEKYKRKVEAIRDEANKKKRDEMKATLPAITPSGLFSVRNARGLIKHSGLLQFDIDLKGNEEIDNYNELKDQVVKIENVAYVGLSVSGTGLWGLVPIVYPEKHRAHFMALAQSFRVLGIRIDPACNDVCRLRGYSYDPEGYFNHQAIPFVGTIEPKKPKFVRYTPNGDDDAVRVESSINQLRVDITGDYKTWFEIGCSLANTFGEAGRNYFHSISQFHSKYSIEETDKQFNHCLKNGYSFKLGTLLHYLRLVGINQ